MVAMPASATSERGYDKVRAVMFPEREYVQAGFIRQLCFRQQFLHPEMRFPSATPIRPYFTERADT